MSDTLNERIVHQFQHASVIYTEQHSAATNRRMPKLYVQAIDQYRYQRELIIQFRHQSGNSSKLYWECVAYRHPGRRFEQTITAGVATRFIDKFLRLCSEYPSLLFNQSGDHTTDIHRPRHENFVHMHERLLDGYRLSVDLL